MAKTPRFDIYALVTRGARWLAGKYLWVLIGATLLTIASIAVLPKLRFNSDLADLLPQDHPDLQILRRIQKEYATDTGFMVLLSKNFVYAVDRGGTIHQHNGRSWKRWPFEKPLHTVWGLSAGDVLVAGSQGTLLHFDGNKWKPLDSGSKKNLRGVWRTITSIGKTNF